MVGRVGHLGRQTVSGVALALAAAVFLGSALPATAQEPESLELSVTPEEVEPGTAAVISSVSPCRDATNPNLVTEVDIAIAYVEEIVASDTFTANSPDDPSRDGSWSWSWVAPRQGAGGVHTVVASCYVVVPDPETGASTRRLLGDYAKTDFWVWPGSTMDDLDPVGPPRPDPLAPPIGSGYAEIVEAGSQSSAPEPAPTPPPATAVLARPNFAG